MSDGENAHFVPFPVLEPPRHSVGCATELLYNAEERRLDKVVLWVAGGVKEKRGR